MTSLWTRANKNQQRYVDVQAKKDLRDSRKEAHPPDSKRAMCSDSREKLANRHCDNTEGVSAASASGMARRKEDIDEALFYKTMEERARK